MKMFQMCTPRASGSNAEDTEVRTGCSMLAGSALIAKRQSEVFILTNLTSILSSLVSVIMLSLLSLFATLMRKK